MSFKNKTKESKQSNFEYRSKMNTMDDAKSPEVSTKFKKLYKAVSPGAPGAMPWKEVYRKRCYERLLDSRQALLEKFRFQDSDSSSSRTVAVQNLVMNEWRAFTNDLNKSSKTSSSCVCKTDEDEDVDVECINIDDEGVLAVLDEITAELLKEEQQILNEYEARNKLDDEALCASIKCLTTSEVICPVCQKSQLFLNRGVVFCSCGLRIDTEQDCITLDMIGSNLHTGIELHSSCCQEAPAFSIVNHPGITNLLMTCAVCDFMYIVV